MKSNQKMFMKNFFENKHLFDFSKYESIFFNLTNKRVTGKIKDEFKGIPINKFIELKSKVYCIISNNDVEVNTGRGVNILTEFNECKNVLCNGDIISTKMKRIQSKIKLNIKLILMMSIKYHHHVLIIKHTF